MNSTTAGTTLTLIICMIELEGTNSTVVRRNTSHLILIIVVRGFAEQLVKETLRNLNR